MICEVESCMDDVGLSRSRLSSNQWTSIVRQQMLELEGPTYQYVPMFSSVITSQVSSSSIDLTLRVFREINDPPNRLYSTDHMVSEYHQASTLNRHQFGRGAGEQKERQALSAVRLGVLQLRGLLRGRHQYRGATTRSRATG